MTVTMQMYEHGCPGLEGKKACPPSAGMLVSSNQVGEGKNSANYRHKLNYRDKQGVERTRPLGLVA